MGFVGIFIGFGILLLGVWKKYNLILVTLLTTLVIGLTNGMGVMEVWQGPFIQGFTGFAAPFMLLFCFGALFGKLMEKSGATEKIGLSMLGIFGEKFTIFAYMLATALLTYGGVSGFVIVFVMLPLAKVLFNKGKIPWYLFPAVTYAAMLPAIGIMPGSLQIQNMIPTKYLGTTLTSAPVLGIILSLIYLAMILPYLWWRVKKGRKDQSSMDYAVTANGKALELTDDKNLPGFIISIIPIVIALVSINIIKINIVYGLILACISCIVLFWKRYENLLDALNSGISNGIMPTVLVGVVVGVAKVVASTSAFSLFKTWLLEIPVSGFMKLFVVTNSVAFITGSGTGAISTTLEIFAKHFIDLGLNPGIIHKIVIMSACGFDSMPWNSFIVLLIAMSGVSYKTSYKYIFMTTVVFTLVTGLIGVLMASLI